MYIISAAAVFQLFLYDILPELIYGALYRFFIVRGGFYYPDRFDEFHHIMTDVVMIITTAAASLITGFFIIFCLGRFAAAKPGQSGYGEDPGRILLGRFALPKNAPALFAVGLCISQFSLYIYMFADYILYSAFGLDSGIYAYGGDSYFPVSAAGVILYFIAIVITPAVFEEFIFRYIMLNSLKKYGNVFAITATSILFGFAHGRVSAFFYATAVGFFSAYIAVKTKSIWFPVILHAAVNCISFFSHYMSDRLLMEEKTLDIIYFLFLTFISAVSFIYLLITASRRRIPLPGEKRVYISNGRKVFFFFNAASVIFFIITFIRGAEEYGFSIFR